MVKRNHERAGLSLPSSKIKSEIRKRLTGKNRLSKHVEIVVTAQIQHLIETLLNEAAERVTNDEKRIYAKHLHQAMNEADSSARGLFPGQVAGIY